MGHPKFTENFKTDAVKQIAERGHSISDVSQRLGVSTHSLYVRIKRHTALLGIAAKDDQSAEIRRLGQPTLVASLRCADFVAPSWVARTSMNPVTTIPILKPMGTCGSLSLEGIRRLAQQT